MNASDGIRPTRRTVTTGLAATLGAGGVGWAREPGETRPAEGTGLPADDRVVKAAIHPSVGVARVGDSWDGWFLGPEVPDPLPAPPGSHRDAAGALKRQAARFRVYGLNAAGEAVAELTAGDAEIAWTVHLANKKAAWFQFQLAQDIPEAATTPPQLLRNASVADRAGLVIDPGPRRVSGRDRGDRPEWEFDGGRFMGKPVYLGELRTDGEGRLIVLGGRGVSASYDGSRAVTFANNEAWHDDVSDGPVTAEVRYGGRRLDVAPAWVVVAPPNYAPLQKSVRTMWDVMRDVAVAAGTLRAPARPSFERDIRPVFERLTRLQWVNAGFAAAFGWGAAHDFTRPEWLEKLSSDGPAHAELRRTLHNQFRDFDRDSNSPVPWPWLYGDAVAIPPADTPRQHCALTDTQLRMLGQWAAGDFDADHAPGREPPRSLDQVPVAQQPGTLDRASLEFCLADAFHPGCEMTWTMRMPRLYMAPYRVKHAPPGWREPQYGAAFNQSMLHASHGPLDGQVPGGLTRWMAVPWQTDTASCRSGYSKQYDPNVPTFWPARVPNQVLSEDEYEVVMDSGRPLGERLAAFAHRVAWLAPVQQSTDYFDQINAFIERFGRMGVVETREGPRGDPAFPAAMEVESLPREIRARVGGHGTGRPKADPTDLTRVAKVHHPRRGRATR